MKSRNDAKKAADAAKQQSSIEPHLEERKVKERVIPYSDALFKEAAIEWLIATDQVNLIVHQNMRTYRIYAASSSARTSKIP